MSAEMWAIAVLEDVAGVVLTSWGIDALLRKWGL